jgi:hypothetical protein
MSALGLRRGDLVEVRSASEILATLDERGCLGELPFMPEMVAFCGRRLTVLSRADKVCDTIASYTSRRILDTVLLDDLRCDGSGHAGCQAECRLYWHESWLRRAEGTPTPAVEDGSTDRLLDLARRNAASVGDDGATRYSCQATEMLRASEPLSTMSPAVYLNEYRNGDAGLGRFVRVMARAAVVQPLHKAGVLPAVPVKGPSSKSPVTQPLDLQPGEWVRVKTKDEIAATLTDQGKNFGLWFDREMLPFCGGTYQVRERITRIVDERTGALLELTRDCVTLEGVICSGERSTSRWFCPRGIPAYWRECWLERADPPTAR